MSGIQSKIIKQVNVIRQPGWEGSLGGTDTCTCMAESLCCCNCHVINWLCMDCSLPGSSVHAIVPARILEKWGCHFFLQGIFPTQGLNLHLLFLLHWQAILYHWATYSDKKKKVKKKYQADKKQGNINPWSGEKPNHRTWSRNDVDDSFRRQWC